MKINIQVDTKEFIYKEWIINRYDQLEIWRKIFTVCGAVNLSQINLKQKFSNPFRKDPKPGCWLYEWNEMTLLADFGDNYFQAFTIFKAVQHLYNCDFQKSCKIIYYDFIDHKDFNFIKLNTKPIYEKRNWFKIYPKKREWTKQDEKYWNNYGISIKENEQENVFPIKGYYSNEKKDTEKYSFYNTNGVGHSINIGNRHKVVLPKKNSPTIFICDFKGNEVGGHSILNSNFIIITKAYKDYRVVSNLKYDSRYLHSESVSLPENFLEFLSKTYDFVYFLMDNDVSGKKAAVRLETQYNKFCREEKSKGIWLTTNSKDPSDCVKDSSYTVLSQEIKNLL